MCTGKSAHNILPRSPRFYFSTIRVSALVVIHALSLLQAIKALKEEGIEVVLMNPNIASVQTNTDNKSPHKADQVRAPPPTVP